MVSWGSGRLHGFSLCETLLTHRTWICFRGLISFSFTLQAFWYSFQTSYSKHRLIYISKQQVTFHINLLHKGCLVRRNGSPSFVSGKTHVDFFQVPSLYLGSFFRLIFIGFLNPYRNSHRMCKNYNFFDVIQHPGSLKQIAFSQKFNRSALTEVYWVL